MAAACAAAVAAAGCSGADKAPGQPEAGSYGVCLMPAATAQVSRADSPFPTALAFKAWAFKQNASNAFETVIPGYSVAYDDAEQQWVYEGLANPDVVNGVQYLKYWDAASLYYDFWAVYPPAAATGCGPGGLTISNAVGNIPDDPATDVLIAHTERHIADSSAPYDIDAIDLAYTMPYLRHFHEVVPLRFHHLFPQVRVYIYNESADDIKVKGASMDIATEFYSKGSWGDGAWSYSEADKATELYSNDAITGVALPPQMEKKDAVELTAAPIRQLPQAFLVNGDGNAVFHVEVVYTVPSTDEHGNPQDLTMAPTNDIEVTGGWRMDAVYKYYLRIPASGGLILVDIAVDDYDFGDEYDREVTDW